MRPHLPASYGGISGAGLWQVDRFTTVADRYEALAHVTLQGVAFYEEFTTKERLHGRIRCHGRKSIYTVVGAAVEADIR